MGIGITLLVIGAAFFGSVSRGLTGFAFALIVMPFFLLVMDVEDAVIVSSLLGTVGVSLLMVQVWRDVPWHTVSRLLLGSLAGMPLGLAVLLFAPQDPLRIGVGVCAILMGAALMRGLRISAGGTAPELAVGALAGLLKTSTSISGPPVVLYLQGKDYPPTEFRAALITFFLLGYLISVSAFFGADVVTGKAMALAAIGTPAVVTGTWAGHRMLPYVDPDLFRRIVLFLLVATALSAIGSSVYRLAG